MNRQNGLLVYLILILTLSSCGVSDSVEPVTFQNLYSLEVPSFMEATTALNDDASLQYQNLIKELYVIVIHETKDEINNAITDNNLDFIYSKDFDGYSQMVVDNFNESINIINRSEISDIIINGLKAKTFTLSGTVEGVEAYFKFCLVEGNDNYYQIMTWTLEDRKDKYSEKMNSIINSFKEV